jgi:hypothetical protein
MAFAPEVLFSDGDMELARAISTVFPQTVHLLCRFHIAQNITKSLAGILRTNLSKFLDEFWSVGSIEDLEEYENRILSMEEAWPQAQSYLRVLRNKEQKWAFAYTHRYFVAGISSTQRQEQINCQIKTNLMSNSTLSRLVEGFESVEKSTQARRSQCSLQTKLATLFYDPIINDALAYLTSYCGSILKKESELSMRYKCCAVNSSEELYSVSHKDHPEKWRVVTVNRSAVTERKCSCRKAIWHGIVCRHITCAFRHCNLMALPLEMINPRWKREFISTSQRSVAVDLVFGPSIASTSNIGFASSEEQRIAELSSISKSLILRSVSEESTYNMVHSTLQSLSDTVLKSQRLTQNEGDDIPIRNPSKVRTKGRPKTGAKRYVSQADKQRSKRKRSQAN